MYRNANTDYRQRPDSQEQKAGRQYMKTRTNEDIRLVAVDLDNTLLKSDKTVSQCDREALAYLMQHHVRVVIASGRFITTNRQILTRLRLGLEHQVNISDGGGTLFQDGTMIRKLHPMADHIYRELVRESKMLGFVPYAADGRTVYRDSAGPLDRVYAPAMARHPHMVRRIDNLENMSGVLKLIYHLDNSEDFKKLKKLESESVTVFRSSASMAEITDRHLGKWDALQVIMDDEKIEARNVLCIGDSGNDADMLRGAGIGAAVSNALPEAVEAADIVGTASNDENGVSQIIYSLFGREDLLQDHNGRAGGKALVTKQKFPEAVTDTSAEISVKTNTDTNEVKSGTFAGDPDSANQEKEKSVNHYKENRKAFAKELESGTLAVISSGRTVQCSLDADYPFYPDNNYYYLTGLSEPDALYAVYKDAAGKVSEMLFLPEPVPEQEKWTGIKMRADEAYLVSDIRDIQPRNMADQILGELIGEAEIFAADAGQAGHQRWIPEDQAVLKAAENCRLLDVSPILARLRLYKKPWELELMKQAVDITSRGINAILGELHAGMYEYECAALFEYIVKSSGAELSFPTIAASGKNGPILHYETNREKMKPGTLVLFDLGARYRGYAADVSRTFPVSGEFTTSQRSLYDVVLGVQKDVIQSYQAGVSLVQLQQMTVELYKQRLPKAGFPLPPDGIAAWYYHSIGHSLGLDTHDGVSRDLVLEPGMVITCEPGIYLAERNVGIRIEDDILITEDGPVNLTEKIVKDPARIEHLMK
jgi:Xaa-Pro aminopeptidase